METDVDERLIEIVVDLGHSLFAKETPADALHLVNDHGKLFTVEVNDNWREWDDDLPVGSVHLIETLEFFLAIRDIGWTEPILLDQFPFREDPVEAARTSINTIRAIDAALDRIDLDALNEAQADQDPLAAQAILTFDERLQTARDLADVPIVVQELTG